MTIIKMTAKDDLISVIIPVYNSEKFLAATLESIVNQTYKNIEIIVVDDGSTDSSPKILEQFDNQIIKINQSNQGLSSSLNVGIKKASGKWFKWFSPDDILYHDAIEILVNEAKTQPEKTIIYSNWDIIDENGKKMRSFSESNYNNLNKFDFNVRLLDGQQINVNTTLIPSNIFHDGCIFRNLKDPVAIDYDFFLRAAILYNVKFHLIPKSLIGYRIHSTQLSHKNILKTLLYLPELRSEILAKLEKSESDRYAEALNDYVNKKSFSQKSIGKGLTIATKVLPSWITDKLLVFYVNKVRRGRS